MTEVTEATFSGKLGCVTITGDVEADEAGLIGEHTNMELVQVQQYGNEGISILENAVKRGTDYALSRFPSAGLKDIAGQLKRKLLLQNVSGNGAEIYVLCESHNNDGDKIIEGFDYGKGASKNG